MTVINTNVGALTARTYALQANDAMQQSMERLSSGLRINSAADDAAGMAVSNKMESQLRGMNVAIRNSQDGISLVQTAEAGMGEITNMIIRMRELSVQMNNGVYTDSDRTNAQLEVTALLAEIDKIASNTAFNDVKVLDGSYQKDLRAGNTNVENIAVSIKRMNTDTLGGNSIDPTVVTTAVIANQTSSVARQGSVNATAVAADKITFQYANFSQGMKDFVSANGGGTFTVSDTTNWAMDSNNNLYTKTATVEAAGTHKVDVTYSSGSNTFKDTVTIVVAANSSTAAIKASTSNISVAETSAATINAVTADSFGAVTAKGDLSAELRAFVLADSSGGKFTLAGDDAGFFTVSNTADATFGAITSSGLDKEATGAAADNNNDDVFAFKLVYTSSTGDEFTETVNLTVTDLAESTWKIAAPTTTAVTGDKYSVIVNGTEIKTASFSSGSGDFSAASAAGIVSALNTANGNLGSPLAGAFSASGSDILWTWNETNPAGSGTISGLYKHAAADAGSTITTADGNGSSAIEKVTFGGAVATLTPAILVKGDKIAITLANGKYIETAAIGETGFASAANNPTAAEIIVALNNAATAVSAGGAFALAANSLDIEFEYAAGDFTNYGAQTDFKKITISGTDSGSTINAENTITGVAHGATSSITVGTPSTTSATATLNGNYASRGNTDHEITKASTVVTLPESGKISLDKAVLSAGFNAFVTNAAHANGKYSLSGTDAKYFSVDQSTGVVKNELNMDYETKNSFDFVLTYTDSSAKTFDETVNLKLTDSIADSGTHLADLNIKTQSGAAAAVTILDTALNQISASQAELGAVQNRLQHNIDNLSMGSMLTETARGRIVDADFAKETSELSKNQILGQAATSMLAQANQSKQSVLALLQ